MSNVRVNCQVAGTLPQDGTPCPYWNTTTLSCDFVPKEDQDNCLYQVHPGFEQADLFRKEEIEVPQDVESRTKLVRAGAARIQELWGVEVYASVTKALEISGKYQPGDERYTPAHLENGDEISADIVHLTALGTQIAVVLGEAEADHKKLDAWRSRLHAEKYMEIKESYASGLRRGKLTDKGLDYHVRCDPQYAETVQDTLAAERQVLVLRGFSDSVIELVNALKKRLEALMQERKYAR